MNTIRLLMTITALIAARVFGDDDTHQSVTIPPAQAYAAFIVPDPGATLTLTINAASCNELVESAVVPSDTGDANLWSPTNNIGPGPHVYTSGTILSSREWLRIHGKYKPTCGSGGDGSSALPEFDVDVPSVDIDIAGVAEEDEEAVGGIVFLNADDDNTNGTPDMNDSGTVANENDLVKITIGRVQSTNRFSGQVSLSAPAGGNKIRLWVSSNKVSQVNLPATFDTPSKLPTNLWVEGIAVSATPNDVELKVSFIVGGKTTEDKVKLTVVKLNLGVAVYRALDSATIIFLAGDFNHTGLVTGYTGSRTKTDLNDDAKWEVTQMPGLGQGPNKVTLSTYKGSLTYHGSYSVANLADDKRNLILKNAQDILNSTGIGYTWIDAIDGKGPGLTESRII